MSRDLSKYSHPIGNLFECDADAERRRSWMLSDEQLAFFHENGFVADHESSMTTRLKFFAANWPA